MAAIICPHCGMANRAGSNFCNFCGVALQEQAARPAPSGPESGAQADQPPMGPSDPELPRRPRRQPPAAQPPPPHSTPAQAEGLPAGPEADQPWLRPEQEDLDMATPPQEAPDVAARGRLLAGVQGLLEPLSLDEILPTTADPPASPVPIPLHLLRRLTSSQEPMGLVSTVNPRQLSVSPLQRSGLLFLFIGLALGLPVLLLATSSASLPHRWPGVTAAYHQIDALTPGAVVLVNWAYDPAMAGEMDLVALPVIKHLLSREAKAVLISQLPGGPATARRLFERASSELLLTNGLLVPTSGRQQALVEGGFLPGGVAVLPLLGAAPARSVPPAPGPERPLAADALEVTAPALSLVVAAQAEDVQQWLEQVQPLGGVPTIAVTSAGADPILRPYWDSGQLSGLVSGFDGGYSYQEMDPLGITRATDQRMRVMAMAQEWGHLAILLLLIAGNLQVILRRRL